MLIKRKEATARRSSLAAALGSNASGVVDRRRWTPSLKLYVGKCTAKGTARQAIHRNHNAVAAKAIVDIGQPAGERGVADLV